MFHQLHRPFGCTIMYQSIGQAKCNAYMNICHTLGELLLALISVMSVTFSRPFTGEKSYRPCDVK